MTVKIPCNIIEKKSMKISDCDDHVKQKKSVVGVLGLAPSHMKMNAGTGISVHIPFRLNPIASLAWLGKQLPCPLPI